MFDRRCKISCVFSFNTIVDTTRRSRRKIEFLSIVNCCLYEEGSHRLDENKACKGNPILRQLIFFLMFFNAWTRFRMLFLVRRCDPRKEYFKLQCTQPNWWQSFFALKRLSLPIPIYNLHSHTNSTYNRLIRSWKFIKEGLANIWALEQRQ